MGADGEFTPDDSRQLDRPVPNRTTFQRSSIAFMRHFSLLETELERAGYVGPLSIDASSIALQTCLPLSIVKSIRVNHGPIDRRINETKPVRAATAIPMINLATRSPKAMPPCSVTPIFKTPLSRSASKASRPKIREGALCLI